MLTVTATAVQENMLERQEAREANDVLEAVAEYDDKRENITRNPK